jgi:hypothetical protein
MGGCDLMRWRRRAPDRGCFHSSFHIIKAEFRNQLRRGFPTVVLGVAKGRSQARDGAKSAGAFR